MTNYVLVGTLPVWRHRAATVAFRARVPGWSADEEPAVFQSREEAATMLEEIKTWYGEAAVLHVEIMTLSAWDQLRIQAALSEGLEG